MSAKKCTFIIRNIDKNLDKQQKINTINILKQLTQSREINLQPSEALLINDEYAIVKSKELNSSTIIHTSTPSKKRVDHISKLNNKSLRQQLEKRQIEFNLKQSEVIKVVRSYNKQEKISYEDIGLDGTAELDKIIHAVTQQTSNDAWLRAFNNHSYKLIELLNQASLNLFTLEEKQEILKQADILRYQIDKLNN
ncbi:hypothetical protein BTR22_04355 [Alkalihalophilus pseudofirmus]|uniref:hypothetical protein n=1 Tax=Alkalihalophilus pseudofirmus TaxID=79885 RepID=UPI00095226AB|nr:hypothetical protein BTR22_04355 [Alkalihalophilus pseudofirmus]